MLLYMVVNMEEALEEVEGISIVVVEIFWPDTNTDGRSIPNRKRWMITVQPGIMGNIKENMCFSIWKPKHVKSIAIFWPSIKSA